jgi:hypothetical protein
MTLPVSLRTVLVFAHSPPPNEEMTKSKMTLDGLVYKGMKISK